MRPSLGNNCDTRNARVPAPLPVPVSPATAGYGSGATLNRLLRSISEPDGRAAL